ncbi:MAG: OmpA family protein [Bacteroidia bacterium]
MKKVISSISVVIFLGACSTTGKILKEADRHYENMEYYTAANGYSNYLKQKSDHSAEVKLAECYKHMNRYAEAEKTYASIVTYPEATPKNKLDYAHILKHHGKYSDAAKWYEEYLKTNPNDAGARNELRSCDSIKNYLQLSYQYNIADAGMNSEVSDFSPVFYKEGIVFCSERSKAVNPTQVNQWTGHTYLDLYYVKTGVVNEKQTPTLFSDEINSMYNEGPVCFNKKGDVIYFTRNNLNGKNKPESGKEHASNLEIYTSVLTDGKWSKPQQLSFDNKEYSVGHPALSKDEKRLYFVSDMPGGFGGTDIYYSEITNGIWSVPVNAGAAINTNENEMFPVILVNNKAEEFLYYSSEGLPGMGGLDLYYSEIKDYILTKPTHLNAPLNSPGDDFGIIFAPDGLTGYLSSNRDNEIGHDRIFSFKKYVPEFYVDITLVKKGTREPLAGVKVEINEINHGRKDNQVSSQNGNVFRKIDANSRLVVSAKKESFYVASAGGNNMGKVFSDTIHMEIELDPIVINKAVRLDNIYYDYDKWDIRKDALPALDVLLKIMKENPEIHVELSSHTDSRGSDKYNMKLSQKRAESAVNYIISQGVHMERIYAKGYGETKLLNQCKNGVKCSDEEHQLNRRTEFKVVKIVTQVPAEKVTP